MAHVVADRVRETTTTTGTGTYTLAGAVTGLKLLVLLATPTQHIIVVQTEPILRLG